MRANNSNWLEQYQTMVRDCFARIHMITEWEEEFLSSVKGYLDAGVSLSPKQFETLDNIWEKATRRG